MRSRRGFRVPRYFFHFTDGKRRFTDTVGCELRGLAAVRRHAFADVRDLKAAMCHPIIQDLSGWMLCVADAEGATVFEIGFDLRPPPGRPAPASPRAPRSANMPACADD